MSIFDIIVLALLIFAVVRGAITGIFKQIGVMVGVVVALLFTRLVSSLFSDLVYWITSGGTRLEGTLYYTLVFVSLVLLTFIVSILLHKTSKALKIAWINRVAGAIFGGVAMLLIIGVLLNVYVGLYKYVYHVEPEPIASYSYEPLLQSVSVVMDFIGNYGITFGR
ncbi:MAG: CvpA family protein [Bacteroidales bacterium]|nr:CvpA family protein [Bacteroidales bacterium]MBR5533079.1 CvpA family protein [Bacteroidales bacterium]